MKLLKAANHFKDKHGKSAMAHLLFFGGIAAIAVGIYEFNHPLGIAAGGAAAFWLSLLIDKTDEPR